MHKVRRQTLELELPRETGALDNARRAARLIDEQVMPKLDLLFTRLAPAGRFVKIEKLEVDLGEIPEAGWEAVFVENCFKKIAQSVENQIFTVGANGGTAAKTETTTARAEAVFSYFLKNGRMPWQAAGQPLKTLEAEVFEVLKKGGTAFFESLKPLFLSEKGAVKRLFWQFSPAFSVAVVEAVLGLPAGWIGAAAQIRQSQTARPMANGELLEMARHMLEMDAQSAVFYKKHLPGPVFVARMFGEMMAKAGGSGPASFSKKADGERRLFSQKTDGDGASFSEKADGESALFSKKAEGGAASFSEKADGKSPLFFQKTDGDGALFSQKTDDSNPFIPKKMDGGDAFLSKKEAPKSVHDLEAPANQPPATTENNRPESRQKQTETDYFDGIFIENSGLVLLAPFLPAFFENLGLTENKVFKDEGAAEKGVHLLHFLATGQEGPEEPSLVLPKILCGLLPESPVPATVGLTADEKAEANNLLKAVIEHWPALKNTGPDGLRGGFLVRKGQIRWRENQRAWELRTERQGQDILLERLPWGFSVVKLPWMQSMVRVELN